jgi:hypothetical protein
MKTFLLLSYLLIWTHFSIFGQTKIESNQTKIQKVNNISDLKSLCFNFCDTISIEFEGLYLIQENLPALTNDSVLVKSIVLKAGFSQIDWGSGNWDKGPRFIYLKYKKDNCSCKIYKKYYYNKKQLNGSFDLRITERIICNSDKPMDD